VTWSQLFVLIGAMTGIVGAPLTVLILMVKTLRLDVRSEIAEAHEHAASLERRIGHVERDYTTKEEWLREAAMNRQQLDRIEKEMIRQNTMRETESGLAAHLAAIAKSIEKAVSQ